MKVNELIKELKDMDGDTEVMIGHDFGDHCHTDALNDVEEVEEVTAVGSAYSGSGWAVESEDYPADEDDIQKTVVRIGPNRW